VELGPRLGILGGVFDPPHVGHLALAQAALDRFDLERLLVLVVADPGHKSTVAGVEARLELARLAFADVPGTDVALDRHERTVDSLEELQPPDDSIFIVGADELADLPSWKKPDRVLELVRLGVALRPGVPDEQLRKALARVPTPDRILIFEMEAQAVSSSSVRDRVARGESIADLVPASVAEAIARLGLYAEAGLHCVES
jgi:nicotinate-nucleotide adenylyltransferase